MVNYTEQILVKQLSMFRSAYAGGNINQINEFSPDVAILMLNCTHRDDVKSDVEFLKKVSKTYAEINQLRLPIVVVVNKCDEMAPTRYKNPKDYPESKVKKINEVVQYYKGIIVKNGLKIDNIIAVSSLIDWQTPDGLVIDVDSIENLPKYDIDNLQAEFDGRYKIEELLDVLEEAILDYEAQMGLRMASRLKEVVDRLVNHLIHIFSGISAYSCTYADTGIRYLYPINNSISISFFNCFIKREGHFARNCKRIYFEYGWNCGGWICI